jgi:hypothetical protein
LRHPVPEWRQSALIESAALFDISAPQRDMLNHNHLLAWR